METTVTLDWDPPQGRGSLAVVDNYTISVSPAPPNQPEIIILQSLNWNVTLVHNEAYTINLIATNCIGESDQIVINIRYSELFNGRKILLFFVFLHYQSIVAIQCCQLMQLGAIIIPWKEPQ